jgi:hypothetical protein
MSIDSYHIVPNSDKGGWDVKKSGGERSIKHFETKAEAVPFGRGISQNQKTEFFIHKKNGQIQSRDSHGNDPFPPRG